MAGAADALLGGLADEQYATAPGVAMVEQFRSTDKGGDVHIVTASMHHRHFVPNEIYLSCGRRIREPEASATGSPSMSARMSSVGGSLSSRRESGTTPLRHFTRGPAIPSRGGPPFGFRGAQFRVLVKQTKSSAR